MASEAVITFSEEELVALGLVLTLHRAQDTGMEMLGALHLLAALQEADQGVLRAMIDRIIIRLSVAEDEVFGRTDGLFDHNVLRDRRARMNAHLDQVFSEFEEEGRRLFKDE